MVWICWIQSKVLRLFFLFGVPADTSFSWKLILFVYLAFSGVLNWVVFLLTCAWLPSKAQNVVSLIQGLCVEWGKAEKQHTPAQLNTILVAFLNRITAGTCQTSLMKFIERTNMQVQNKLAVGWSTGNVILWPSNHRPKTINIRH